MNPFKYKELLEAFLDKSYNFKKFENFNANESSQVILRHDIDFSIQMAVQMATIEKDLGLESTYYFLLASDSYNLLSKEASDAIKAIQNMGHSVGLHFDPTVYEDEKIGFKCEVEIFERRYGRIFSMSFHRPSKSILEGIDWLPKRIIGAYQAEYFTDITYISDSQGAFRFGHPCEHKSFAQGLNMQLLIHPIWWMTDGEVAVEKIQQFIQGNASFMSDHVAKNCIPWRNYVG
ncbi:hypothetical protein OAC03_02690 [Amylibacter sp.]|nr:hypothetical protein [Amylibacter sp.]